MNGREKGNPDSLLSPSRPLSPNQLLGFVIASCHLGCHLFNIFLEITSQFLPKCIYLQKTLSCYLKYKISLAQHEQKLNVKTSAGVHAFRRRLPAGGSKVPLLKRPASIPGLGTGRCPTQP